MRNACLIALLAVAVGLAAPAVPAGAAASYYVSMGDTLGSGYQPTPAGGGSITNRGYTDVVLRGARRHVRGLRVLRLSCPGETTHSFIAGGRCSYSGGAARGKSQLAAARRFLRGNRDRVAFATLSLGPGDLYVCADPRGTLDAGCVRTRLASARRKLPRIARELRRAAGPRVRIAVLLHYDPFLAFHLSGSEYSGLAALSVGLVRDLNGAIRTAARGSRLLTVDAFRAFHSTDLAPATVGGTQVPRSVVYVCRYTFMCTAPPQGPDFHLNTAGYAFVGRLFLRRLY